MSLLPHILRTSSGEMSGDGCYDIKIRGGPGKEWKTIQALGAPLLREKYERISVPVAKEFLEEFPELDQQDGGLDRPEGDMCILLGEDALRVFPVHVKESKCGRQRLARSKFTNRLLVQGAPDIVNDKRNTTEDEKSEKVAYSPFSPRIHTGCFNEKNNFDFKEYSYRC